MIVCADRVQVQEKDISKYSLTKYKLDNYLALASYKNFLDHSLQLSNSITRNLPIEYITQGSKQKHLHVQCNV